MNNINQRETASLTEAEIREITEAEVENYLSRINAPEDIKAVLRKFQREIAFRQYLISTGFLSSEEVNSLRDEIHELRQQEAQALTTPEEEEAAEVVELIFKEKDGEVELVDSFDIQTEKSPDQFEEELRSYGLRSTEEAESGENCYYREFNLFTLYTYLPEE